MQNVYLKTLSKAEIFNHGQNAEPVGDVVDTKLKLVGVHHKTVTTGDGEEKLLTIIFVDEDGEIKSYFSSARSFFNGLEDVCSIFGSDIEKGGIEITVTKVETRNRNTVYVINL